MAALLVTAALAGCVRKGPPAPVDDRGVMFFGRGTALPTARPAAERPRQGGSSSSTTTASARIPLVSTPGTVTVQSGDTLYSISRHHNVPIRAIINANNLAPPYLLAVGRPLVLPQQPYHRVGPGETVASISRAYGVSTQDLIRANGIEAPYVIYVGQPIVLPIAAPQGTTAVASAPVQAPPPAISPQALPSPSAPGQSNPTPSSASQSYPAPSVEPPMTNAPAWSPPGPPDSIASMPGEGPPTGAVSGDSVASLPPPSAPAEAPVGALPGAFIWPVQGRVLSGFGSKPGGLVNDGINIAAPAGTPVRAAQDGTVAYAGNELRGYGNLLLVRHENGWMTAYAHAGELLVGRGDRVKRGQVIARVGASGNVGEPQLHFEMRQGARSVDPTRYLSGQGISSR